MRLVKPAENPERGIFLEARQRESSARPVGCRTESATIAKTSGRQEIRSCSKAGPHPRGRPDVDRAALRRLAGRAGQLRQAFNDTHAEVLWLIVGGPGGTGISARSKSKMDLSLIYPVDPKQLPKELAGVEWPQKSYVFALLYRFDETA